MDPVSYLCPNNNNLPQSGKSHREQLVLVTRSLPSFIEERERKKKRIFHATTKLQPKVIGRVYDFLFRQSIAGPPILCPIVGKSRDIKGGPANVSRHNNITEQRSVPALLPFYCQQSQVREVAECGNRRNFDHNKGNS